MLPYTCLVDLFMLSLSIDSRLGYAGLCLVGLVMLPYTVLSMPCGLGYAALCSPIYA